MEKKNRKFAHCYDYSGHCSPLVNGYVGAETFSVGIFQWVPTTSASGLRKDAVIYRVKGYCRTPEKVYARAEEVCDLLDGGFFLKNKSELVK